MAAPLVGVIMGSRSDWPTMAHAYQQMFDGIPAAERQAFVATLQKILNNIRVHEF